VSDDIATPPTVIAALSAVMRDLPGIGKTDRSPEGFDFRGIEAMTKVVGPALAAHGVVIVPSATLTQTVVSPAMKDGWQDIYLEVDWTIYGPAGDSITARTNGIGRDKTDRGANKAATQAFKYLLLQVFCIADRADDADGHSYEQDRVEGPAPLGKRAAGHHVKACLRDRGEPEDRLKDLGAQVWADMALDKASPYTLASIEQAVADWYAKAEPFTEPDYPVTIPAKVDRETGEVLVPEQTIHPDQGVLA
jgi:hypothetical protein